MALSEDTLRKSMGGEPGSFIHKSADVAYKGSVMVGESSTGHVRNADGAADAFFIGLYGKGTRNQDGTYGDTGDGSARVPVSWERQVLEDLTVAGYTSAALNFKPVYATDDDTFTLTRPSTDAVLCGMTVRYSGTSGIGDVLMLSALDSMLLGLSGAARQTLYLGSFDLDTAVASGKFVTDYRMSGHGKIVGFYLMSDGEASAAGDVDVNLDIGGVDVTDSQISILTAGIATVGDKLATDSAISGANEYFDGDLLGIDISAVTAAYTDGNVGFYIEVELLP